MVSPMQTYEIAHDSTYPPINGGILQGVPLVARLLTVGSDPFYGAALRQSLEQDGALIYAAENQDAFLALLAQKSYDLAIIDMESEGFGGIALLDYLSHHHPNLSLLVLTEQTTVVCSLATLRARVVDFLQKPVAVEVVVNRVQQIIQNCMKDQARQQAISLLHEAIALLHYTAQPGTENGSTLNGFVGTPNRIQPTLKMGHAQQDQQIDYDHSGDISSQNGHNQNGHNDHREKNNGFHIQAGVLTLDREKRVAMIAGKPPQTVELTEGEASILDILITQADHVLSCRQLARAICEYDLEEIEAQSLVRPYIFRLRHKLEHFPNHPQWIRTVRGRGYLLTPFV